MIIILDWAKEKDVDFKVLLGFDGFVDKILKPIKSKTRENSIPFETMLEFSDYVKTKAGKSCSIDLEMVQEKLGGNMPIIANALSNLGCDTTCIGAMGVPEIHPAFRKMNEKCHLISVSHPGYCEALEFEDGKLMLATNFDIDALNYDKILKAVGETNLIQYFTECDAYAFLNWGELICSNDILANLMKNILPKCNFMSRKIMFIDFSDFSKRKDSEVSEMVKLLNQYAEYFNITISVNQNELDLLIEKLHIKKTEHTSDDEILELYEKFRCENFVIHLLENTKYVENNSVKTIEKEVIKDPKIITGGGDNFNAGLLFGLLLGHNIEEAIVIAGAVSCLYVREAENVSLDQLKNYLKGEI